MAALQSRVTVTTDPTRLDSTALATSDILIRNADASASVFLGNSAVTASDGFELKAGESFETSGRKAASGLYAISAGSVVCHVLQVGGN